MTRKEISDYFSRVIEENKIPHAIIIDGVSSEADKEPAYTLARKLLGSYDNIDVIVPLHEKEHLISTDEIRKQISDNVVMKPYANDYKIYYIDANLLNEAGQNILLKNLEEPPRYAIFVLFVKNISSIIETVQSRCQVLSLTDESSAANEMTHAQRIVATIAAKAFAADASMVGGFIKELDAAAKEEGISYPSMFDVMRKIIADAIMKKQGSEKRYYKGAEDLAEKIARQETKDLLDTASLIAEAEKRYNYKVNNDLLLKDLFVNWRKS